MHAPTEIETVNKAPTNFLEVTEVAGDGVSREQIDRMVRRYAWAGTYCRGKDVIEVGSGSGQGLGFLREVARSVVAGDVSPELVAIARRTYGDSFPLVEMDAHHLPFEDRT